MKGRKSGMDGWREGRRKKGGRKGKMEAGRKGRKEGERKDGGREER